MRVNSNITTIRGRFYEKLFWEINYFGCENIKQE